MYYIKIMSVLQANGLDEHFNQSFQTMLKKYVQDKKKSWDEYIDTCVLAYNTSRHESTTFTPFELMFGMPCLSSCGCRW